MGEQLNIWDYAKLSTTDIVFREDTPYDVWEAVGEKLNTLVDSGRWGIGGWAEFGERRFGEEYANAVAPNRSKRIDQCRWVWNCVPREIRRETLTFSHHRAIAGIKEIDIQRKLLEMADANGWDVSTLMAAVKQAKKTAGADVQPPPFDSAGTTRLFGEGGAVKPRRDPPPAPPQTGANEAAEPPGAGFTPRVVAGKDVDQADADQYVFFWAVIEAARDAIAKGEITDQLRKAVADIDALEAISKRNVG
jgi:hypothetical protein